MSAESWTERSCLFGLFLILPRAAFWPCLRLPFIQDDWGFLLELQTNNTAALLANFFHPGGAIFYRPLAATYLLALYKLFGVQPCFFHVLALAIHIFNALLVFRIMTHLLRDRGIGLLTGLLYAVAVSIHLDPLCWAVGIYDIGGACFFFMAIWFFIRERPKTSVACFLAGVLFKESVMVLPLIIAGLLWYRYRSGPWKERGCAARQLLPHVLELAVIIGMKFFGGVSPIALPPSHPYAIDFAGWHVVTNGRMYLSWMCQALLPFENRVILFLLALALCVIAGVAMRKGGGRQHRRAALKARGSPVKIPRRRHLLQNLPPGYS